MTSNPNQSEIWADVYSKAVAELARIGTALAPEQIERPVPATPGWTVRQLFGHLSGASADIATGRLDGVPGETWTSPHVAEREEQSIEDAIAELRRTEAAVIATLPGMDPPLPVFDKVVHLADLTEALNLPRPPEFAHAPLAMDLRPRLEHLVGEQAQACDDYTVVRITFSRRSMNQLRALFPGVDDAQLARVGFFGPREDDQPTSD